MAPLARSGRSALKPGVRSRAMGRTGEGRRFLTGPRGCEITGITMTPDSRTLFINIQHPGENTAAANIADASKYESHWPGNGAGVAAYGPGGATARPRSATVMITKDDGGVIGL